MVDLVCHSINGAPRLFGNLEREHGLAGPGLAFDQQRALERDGGIDRDLEVVGRDIRRWSLRNLPCRQHKRFAGDTCAAVHAVVA